MGNMGAPAMTTKQKIGQNFWITLLMSENDKAKWLEKLTIGMPQTARGKIDIPFVEGFLKRMNELFEQELDSATVNSDEEDVEREEQESDEYIWAEESEDPRDPEDVAAEEETRQRLIKYLYSK